MKKQHAWPERAWNWPIKVCQKHAVRCGEILDLGGRKGDLTPQVISTIPSDVPAQTKEAVHHFARALEALDCDLADVVWLLCFYVNDGSLDEQAFSLHGRRLLARSMLASLALPCLFQRLRIPVWP